MPVQLQSNIEAVGIREPQSENICMASEVLTAVHVYCGVIWVYRWIKSVKTGSVFKEISPSTVFYFEKGNRNFLQYSYRIYCYSVV
jgi:hypothetical protein